MGRVVNIEIDSSVQSLVEKDGILSKLQKEEWQRLLNGELGVRQIEKLLTGILYNAKKKGVSPEYHALMLKTEEVDGGGEVQYYTFSSKRLDGWQGFKLVNPVDVDIEVEGFGARVAQVFAPVGSFFSELLGKYKWRSLKVSSFATDGVMIASVVALLSLVGILVFAVSMMYGDFDYERGFFYDGSKSSSQVSKPVSVKGEVKGSDKASSGSNKPREERGASSSDERLVDVTSVFSEGSRGSAREEVRVPESRVSESVVEREVPRVVPIVPSGESSAPSGSNRPSGSSTGSGSGSESPSTSNKPKPKEDKVESSSSSDKPKPSGDKPKDEKPADKPKPSEGSSSDKPKDEKPSGEDKPNAPKPEAPKPADKPEAPKPADKPAELAPSDGGSAPAPEAPKPDESAPAETSTPTPAEESVAESAEPSPSEVAENWNF